jgi:vacuolar-type H+-ATPase subunit H
MSMDQKSSSLEMRLTDFMAGAVPWLAPIPSAALVVNATQRHLGWSEPIAVIAGAIIEGLGLTSTSMALTLWDFNARKSADEPKAPFWLAALLVAMYFLSTIGLTVVLDVNSSLSHVAPALFPILAIVATVNIALRSQHAHRLERIAQTEADAKEAARQAEEERKQLAAEAKAEEQRREAEAKAEAERLRLEEKAEREARRQERAARQGATRQGATRNATNDATSVATGVGIDRDTFVRLFTTQDYADIEDLAHRLGFNGDLRTFYDGGRRSVARLSQLVGVNPRTGQRWIDASGAAGGATDAAVDGAPQE